jgi:hypothetical protein
MQAESKGYGRTWGLRAGFLLGVIGWLLYVSLPPAAMISGTQSGAKPELEISNGFCETCQTKVTSFEGFCTRCGSRIDLQVPSSDHTA